MVFTKELFAGLIQDYFERAIASRTETSWTVVHQMQAEYEKRFKEEWKPIEQKKGRAI